MVAEDLFALRTNVRAWIVPGTSACCLSFRVAQFHRAVHHWSFIVLTHDLLSLDALCNRRKKEAREAHENAAKAKKTTGIKAKLLNKSRHSEKIQMKKTCVCHIFYLNVHR